MEKLNELIAKCVTSNTMFAGMLGSQSYTVQELMHACSLQTLNSMFQSTKKQLASLETDSLFKNSNSARRIELSLKVDVIESIFNYKQELVKKANEKAKLKAEAIKKLTILTNAAEAGEIERIKNLSPKELAKEIKKAEKLAK